MVDLLGLIVNPVAGYGVEHNLAVARRAVALIAPRRVLTGPGALGADAVPAALRAPLDVGRTDEGGRAMTQSLAVAAARGGAEALVVVGGDGTLADVAIALDSAGADTPLIGIGAGSTNVGALVTCLGEDVDRLQAIRGTGRSSVEPVLGLSVRATSGVSALAFNDVVAATTIVGTLDGAFVNLDAERFAAGERRTARPRPLACEHARVTKLSPGGELLVAAGRDAACVVVGFTGCEGTWGRALVGGVGLSQSRGIQAGCIVATYPLVYADIDEAGHREMEPLRSAYVGLASDEAIRLTGFEGGAYLCADGNPLLRLARADTVEVRLRPEACRVVRIAGANA